MSKPPNVYVVDDDESVRKALTRMFRTLGWQVFAFSSASGLLEAEPVGPGCLILDVRMPGLSGLQLQAELGIRNIRLPVIFMTAYADCQTRARAMEAGAFKVLQKPVSERVLLEAIGEALGERAEVD